MKLIYLSLFILCLTGCTSTNSKQKCFSDMLIQEFDDDDTREHMKEFFTIISHGSDTVVGIGQQADEDIPALSSATYAAYYPKSDIMQEHVYMENTNDNWMVVIFDPISKCPDELPLLEKISEYVFLGEINKPVE